MLKHVSVWSGLREPVTTFANSKHLSYSGACNQLLYEALTYLRTTKGGALQLIAAPQLKVPYTKQYKNKHTERITDKPVLAISADQHDSILILASKNRWSYSKTLNYLLFIGLKRSGVEFNQDFVVDDYKRF
jgi:hypothetical protein